MITDSRQALRPAVLCLLIAAFSLGVLATAWADVWDTWDYPNSKRTLKIYVRNGDATFKKAVEDAIKNWNTGDNNGDWTLEEGTAGDHDVSVGTGKMDGPGGTLGDTEATYNKNTGTVVGAVKITMDSEEDWGDGPTKQNLERAIKHELGHAQRMDDTDKAGDLMNGKQGVADDNLEPSKHDKSEAGLSYTVSGGELDTIPNSLTPNTPQACSIQPTGDIGLGEAVAVMLQPLQPENLEIMLMGWTPDHIDAIFTPLAEAFHNEGYLVTVTTPSGDVTVEGFIAVNDVPPPPDEFPHAEAGPELWVEAGTPIVLDGTASWHDDPAYTSSLVHIWTWEVDPASTEETTAQTRILVVNGLPVGDYVFRLEVEDLFTEKSADDVIVHVLPVSSIDNAKLVPDGTPVQMGGVSVTGFSYRTGSMTPIEREGFGVETMDRASGIRILSNEYVSTGQMVAVQGHTATVSGERVIVASSVMPMGIGAPIQPFDIAQIDSGGGGYGYQGAVVDDALSLPRKMSVGMNNVGLLMRLVGKVTSVRMMPSYDSSCFYIDDAYSTPDYHTGLKDGSGSIGVRCAQGCNESMVPLPLPGLGQYVEVYGIMGVREIGGVNARFFYTQSWEMAGVAQCSGNRHPRWNLLSLPCQPRDPDPAVVFAVPPIPYDPDPIDGRLFRWDAPTQSLLMYDMWMPELFGAVNSSEGYWLFHSSISPEPIHYEGYYAYPLDRWISTPKGWNIMGVPFFHNTWWADWRATDGTKAIPIFPASQYGEGWLNSIGYWFDETTQSLVDFGLPDDFPTTEQLNTWHGYWVQTNKHLGLFAPSWSVAP